MIIFILRHCGYNQIFSFCFRRLSMFLISCLSISRSSYPYEISFGLLPRYRELFFLRILRCRNIPVQIHTIRLLGQPVLPYRYQKAETGGFLVHFNICPYKCQTSFSLVSGLFNGAVNYFTPDLKSLFTKNLYSFLKKYGILNLC